MVEMEQPALTKAITVIPVVEMVEPEAAVRAEKICMRIKLPPHPQLIMGQAAVVKDVEIGVLVPDTREWYISASLLHNQNDNLKG